MSDIKTRVTVRDILAVGMWVRLPNGAGQVTEVKTSEAVVSGLFRAADRTLRDFSTYKSWDSEAFIHGVRNARQTTVITEEAARAEIGKQEAERAAYVAEVNRRNKEAEAARALNNLRTSVVTEFSRRVNLMTAEQVSEVHRALMSVSQALEVVCSKP